MDLELERRLAILERQNVALKRLFWAIPLTLAIGLLVGWRIAPTDIEASSVKILDPDGKVHAVLDPAGLSLFDNSGRPRSILGIHEEQPGLAFLTGEGKASLVMSLGKSGSDISLFDEKDTMRATLAQHGAVSSLKLADEDAKTRLTLSATKDAQAITFLDANGKETKKITP